MLCERQSSTEGKRASVKRPRKKRWWCKNENIRNCHLAEACIRFRAARVEKPQSRGFVSVGVSGTDRVVESYERCCCISSCGDRPLPIGPVKSPTWKKRLVVTAKGVSYDSESRQVAFNLCNGFYLATRRNWHKPTSPRKCAHKGKLSNHRVQPNIALMVTDDDDYH